MATFHVTRQATSVVVLFICFTHAVGTGVFNDNSKGLLSMSEFKKSCKEVLHSEQSCENLWNSFIDNFKCPRDNCEKKVDDEKQRNFIAQQPPVTPVNQAMFYTGKTFERASSYTRCKNKKIIIDNTTLGHIFSGYEWCCVKDKKVVSCDKKCPTKVRFWELLSKQFAENAEGNTTAILNGSSNYVPYNTTSVFSEFEVKNLDGEKVKRMLVLLVYKDNVVTWRCNSPNSRLDVLQNELKGKGIVYQCEEEETKQGLKANNYLARCSDAAIPQSLTFTVILSSTMLVILSMHD